MATKKPATNEANVDQVTPEQEAPVTTPTPPATPARKPRAKKPPAPAPEAVPEPALVDEIAELLAEVGITDLGTVEKVKALGIKSVAQFTFADKEDLVSAGIPPVTANELRSKATTAPEPTTPAPAPAPAAGLFAGIAPPLANTATLLPTIPGDNRPWLMALKSSGNPKVAPEVVVPAIKAGVACKVGFYDLPDELLRAMEAYAEIATERVPDDFLKVEQLIHQRDYSEIAKAFPGFRANKYAGKTKKDKVIEAIMTYLWPALATYVDYFEAWYEKQDQAIAGTLARALAGRNAARHEDTGELEDYGDAVCDGIAKVFAGTRSYTVAAMATEAEQILKILEVPNLHTMVGAPNREQMLRQLGADIAPQYARYEQNMVQFVLAIMQAPNVPESQKLAFYDELSALIPSVKSFLGISDRPRAKRDLTGLTGDRLP